MVSRGSCSVSHNVLWEFLQCTFCLGVNFICPSHHNFHNGLLKFKVDLHCVSCYFTFPKHLHVRAFVPEFAAPVGSVRHLLKIESTRSDVTSIAFRPVSRLIHYHNSVIIHSIPCSQQAGKSGGLPRNAEQLVEMPMPAHTSKTSHRRQT